MFKRFLFGLFALCAIHASAQSIWRDIAETDIPPTAAEYRIAPQRYRTVQLDPAALQAVLDAAAAPDAQRAAASAPPPLLSIPLPDGSAAAFRLRETPVMAPDLQARYPQIRSYTGFSPDDPTALLKCDRTPRGFHAMLTSARWGTVFIDPYSQGDALNYVVYHKKDYAPPARKQAFICGVAALSGNPALQNETKVSARSNDGQMRQYRLAMACTGEYAAFHGGTKPLVLAAIVTSVNRINSVYERELAVTFELIPNNDTLIFLDPDADPYANNNGGMMLGQNENTCDNLIGSANYDIGHVFSTGGGGIAGLGVVCTGSKAHGVTGLPAPIGDPFDIDYVAHEMGHQFSGNHTQNNPCSRNGQTAMEPGSGSTIMGYAGICAPDVQPHSDAYFHGVNVEEMVDFITNGSGNNCPFLTPSGSTAPIVNAGPDYTIPKSTPFVLTAQASDPDTADVLTYCWEQMDADEAVMPPIPTNALGPLFRSFNPDTLPARYFPRLSTLVPGASSDWEKLPSVGRKLNFRVTVRDNNPAGGQTAQDDVLITVDKNTGPFKVTNPNTAAIWRSGEYRVVTWNVANTDKSPVLCQTVNIRLSTDGGFTYPHLLAAGVPNNGSYCIRVPELETTQARLMVEAAGNVFFDISDADLAIAPAAAPSFSLCTDAVVARVCLPQAYSATITTSALLGLDSLIQLSVEGLPIGAVALFTPNPVLPGQNAQLAVSFPDGYGEGQLDIVIRGVVGADTASVQTSLTVVSNDFGQMALLAPANGATGLDQAPVLRWQTAADALTYELEIAYNPAFDSVLVHRQNLVLDSLKTPLLLDKGKVYYWRVRPVNECGPGPWVGPFAFATLVNVCAAFEAGDVPKNITASQAVTIESKITVLASSIVSDVNIPKIQGNHEFFKDLEAYLISPKGTQVLLFKAKCGSFNGNFRFGFDDSGAAELGCPPPNNGTLFRPAELFSAFNGENSAGVWTLRVKDTEVSSGGRIAAFDLEICANTTLNPPFIVQNNVLSVEPGNNKAVTPDLLRAEDADNSASELVFTLMTVPQHGELQLYWTGKMAPGDQFTQADLDNGGLRYFHYGTNTAPDQFCFTVTDGAGGMAQDCFHIQPLPVGADEPERRLDFLLAPNPATESVRLAFGEAPGSDTRIRLFDAAGRLLHAQLLPAGQTTARIATGHLPDGLYTVSVQNARGGGVRKLAVW
ncbi:MAG: proprotein convertase P-domain-containing protein [Saprospirales bacterium]|nr:proprotein convertase P-domain-containing protein [Saprospirales bacterium]